MGSSKSKAGGAGVAGGAGGERMNTKFITIEIDLQETPAQLLWQIEAQLRLSGEPLRWAITNVDPKRHKAIVEATVTLES